MCSFKRTLYLNYTIFQGEILSFLHHYMILKALVFTSDFTPLTQTVYKNYKGINYLWDAGQVIGSSPTLNTQYTYGTWTQCHIEITSSVRQGTWVIKWVRIRQRGTVDFLSIDTDQTSKASHSRRVRADNIVGIKSELCRMSASEKKEMCREQDGGQWQWCSCHFWKCLLLRSVFQTLTWEMVECCSIGDGWKSIYAPVSITSSQFPAFISDLFSNGRGYISESGIKNNLIYDNGLLIRSLESPCFPFFEDFYVTLWFGELLPLMQVQSERASCSLYSVFTWLLNFKLR